jgi:hypothetical protein
MNSMPYKDPERKKEWEQLHRTERLARRRELRNVQTAEQTARPIAAGKASGGIGFVVPLIAGGALAAWNPKLGMGAGSLTLVVAIVWKKELGLVARGVRHFMYRVAFLFHE